MADEPKVEPQGEPMQIGGAPEEGATEQVQQPESQVDIDALVNTLDKIGVRSPDHLEGLYHSAQAQGRTGQELGLARQELARMQEEINRLKSVSRQSSQYDEYGEAQGQPIDLRSEIKSVLRDFYRDEVITPQQQASESYWRDVEQVQSSEYFPVVQEEFEQHMRKPAVQRAMAQGRTTHVNEFHKLLGNKFKDIASQLKTAASALKEQAPRGTTPPHMETGQVPPERTPEGEQAKRQALTEIQKRATGTDDDLTAYIRTLIPDDDPILKY